MKATLSSIFDCFILEFAGALPSCRVWNDFDDDDDNDDDDDADDDDDNDDDDDDD